MILLDIETRETDNLTVIKRLTDKVKPPGNYTKPESIAKWWQEAGMDARREAVARTALDGTWGRLASVAWAVDDGPVECFSGDDERVLLQIVSDMLDAADYDICRSEELVAFNGEFDFRFLHHRYIINRVKAPYLPLSSRNFYDPMREWCGYKEYISQADLEMALGIVRDDGITGADVGTYIALGDWETVEKHNREDVRCLREIYYRMTK